MVVFLLLLSADGNIGLMGANITPISNLLEARGSFPWVMSAWPHSPGWDNPDPGYEAGGG